MSSNPLCPQCHSDNHYPDGDLLVCADCFNEWNPKAEDESTEEGGIVKDSNGTVLADGDSVILIKDLKVKGAGQTLRKGTVIKSIRLTGDAQEIDCRFEGIKGLVLRAEFVRKH